MRALSSVVMVIIFLWFMHYQIEMKEYDTADHVKYFKQHINQTFLIESRKQIDTLHLKKVINDTLFFEEKNIPIKSITKINDHEFYIKHIEKLKLQHAKN